MKFEGKKDEERERGGERDEEDNEREKKNR